MMHSMAPLYDGHDYYKKMFELQEKLRKSEEERIRMEERFNVLVRESRNRHDVCINRLRMRYIQYLEEQRTRDERNHKLLAALDKVMNKLALISAKKDRLNVLRKQYEAYLLRVYANRRPPGSVTGDSGIASQNEDRHTRRTAETKSVSSPRVHPGASAQSSQPRSIPASKFHDQIIVNGAPLNNPPILSTTLLGAPLGADYHQTNVLRAPHVYVSPIGQSSDQPVYQPVISTPDARQYLQAIPGYDGGALHDLQGIPNLRVSAAPVLPMADRMQPGAVPANRFLREHVESLQAASGFPATAARFPADAMRYERSEPATPQFDHPSALFQYHDANVMSTRPQSRMREYDPSAMAPTLATAKASTYRAGPDVTVNRINPLPGYMDYMASLQKSEDDGSAHSLTSDDVDDLIKRNEHLLWRGADVAKSPARSSTALDVNNANLDENGRTTAILENELDRYISNIRKLHREHGVPSLEELDHEQNTSGDLLNVTLSEDALELPAEERARKERVPEDMGRILALASDLASRTASLKEVARDLKNDDDGSPAEAADEIGRRRASSEGKREAEGRGTSATRAAESERPRGDAAIAKEGWSNPDESREREQEVSTTRKDDDEGTANNSSQIDRQKSASQEALDLVTGEESDIEDLFDIVEELEPWDLEGVQKKVRELRLDDPNGDRAAEGEVERTAGEIDEGIASELHGSPQVEQGSANGKAKDARLSQDALSRAEVDASEAGEPDGKNEAHAYIENAEEVPAEITNQDQTDEPMMTAQMDEEANISDSKKQESDETVEPRLDDQSEGIAKNDGYNVEGYVEDPSQAQQYEQDPNAQYNYEQSVPYERAGDEEYARYAEQGYAQEGQEYVEYVDGQYEQYPEDPNNQQYQQDPNAQYPEDPNNQQYQQDPNAQYEQDPNQAYDYNYDPNQGYEGDPNQQYDPNQGYDPNNQAYDYAEQTPYDPNQTYDNAYEQEYKAEQPGDYTNEGREEQPETAEALADPERQSERDEGKPQQGGNGASQPTKKKDVIKSLLDSDTDTTIEKNVSNTESDFDFN